MGSPKETIKQNDLAFKNKVEKQEWIDDTSKTIRKMFTGVNTLKGRKEKAPDWLNKLDMFGLGYTPKTATKHQPKGNAKKLADKSAKPAKNAGATDAAEGDRHKTVEGCEDDGGGENDEDDDDDDDECDEASGGLECGEEEAKEGGIPVGDDDDTAVHTTAAASAQHKEKAHKVDTTAAASAQHNKENGDTSRTCVFTQVLSATQIVAGLRVTYVFGPRHHGRRLV